MAFAITNLALFQPSNQMGLPVPGNAATGGPAGASASEADLAVVANTTTSSAIKDMGFALKNFRAYVYLKTMAGTSTVNVTLEVSDSATFATATDVYTLDAKFINAAISTQPYAFKLEGEVPIVAGKRYMRVTFVTGSGTSGTADIIYYAS